MLKMLCCVTLLFTTSKFLFYSDTVLSGERTKVVFYVFLSIYYDVYLGLRACGSLGGIKPKIDWLESNI